MSVLYSAESLRKWRLEKTYLHGALSRTATIMFDHFYGCRPTLELWKMKMGRETGVSLLYYLQCSVSICLQEKETIK